MLCYRVRTRPNALRTLHDPATIVVVATKVFLGYDSRPEVSRETLFNAGRLISETGLADVTSWEQLLVAGRIILRKILTAIDQCELAAFDVTTLNENVLFELGYAIAREKRIWVLLDKTDRESKSRFKEFQLLKTTGNVRWENSEDIRTAFISDLPSEKETLFADLIEPELRPSDTASIFFIPTYHNTDANRVINQAIDKEVHRGIRLTTADPTESAIYPLAW